MLRCCGACHRMSGGRNSCSLSRFLGCPLRLCVVCRREIGSTRARPVVGIRLGSADVNVSFDRREETLTGLERHDARRRLSAAKPSGLSMLWKSAKASATAHPTQSAAVQSCGWWPFPRKYVLRIGSCNSVCRMTFK